MARDSGFHLLSVSVVVTAESHNPSALTADFLASSGIVPPEWTVAQTINLPPVSLLRYSNDVQWTIDPTRLIVTQECGGIFQKTYDVHECVIRFLRRMEAVPYRSLGLNCVLVMETDNPREVLIRRFLRDGPWLDDHYSLVAMIPRFVFEAGGPVLNVSCGIATPTESEDEVGIHVECNVHHEGPHTAAELIQSIENWQRHQIRIEETLNVLFGGLQS